LSLETETLLTQFEVFLQQGEALSFENNDAIANASKQVDLYQLFSELLALKTEVKKDARQQKEALGHFTGMLDTLENGNKQLSQELIQQENYRNNAVTQAKKELLNEVVDLNDRLQATIASMKMYRPPLLERKVSREFRMGVEEGLEMTLRRLEHFLTRCEVVAVEATVGETVNPHTMRVIDIREEKKQADGVVLEEIQRGYLYQGKQLRLAEVIANKLK